MKPNAYLKIFVILALVCSHMPRPAAQASGESLLENLKDSPDPVIVKGDRVEYLQDQKKVTGTGNVSISYGDIKLTCDKITVYTDTKEAICEGGVRISQPGAIMEGEKINYNFIEKKGYALNSKIDAPPFYGRAKRLEQTGEGTFAMEEGYITTCDLPKPHYRIRAKKVEIYLDEKIVAKHTFFYIFDIPVLYMPIYVQPLGLKFPEVTVVPGRTSDWGYYVLTAWRYFFHDNSKGFVHIDYREKKGLAGGVDYKYNARELGDGIARFYYIHENDDLAITKKGQARDRWRMQYRHLVVLPEDTTCTIELNKMSDKDMVKDYLYREYEENPIAENYILMETTKANYTMNILARIRLDDFLTVVQKLPEVKLLINNQRLWNTNFYYMSTNSITNFIKKYAEEDNTPSEESLRQDNYQKISYAAKLFKFLFVTPFAATRQTFYSRNRWKDTSKLRSIYEGGVDVSTKFYRVFDVETDFIDLDIHRLRHIISPSASFLHRHQPTISPDNLYQFDAIDNIRHYNGFSLSLENKLQTKRPVDGKMKAVDLARFIVSTDYTFRLKKKSLASKGDGKFGDLNFKLEVWPYPWLSFDSDMTLDYKNHDINTASLDVYMDLDKKFTLGMGHRYEHTDNSRTSQLTGEIFYNINNDWKVKIYQRYDFCSEKWEEQEYTVYKDLHCWLAELSLDIRDENYTAWVVFRLKAFPDVPIGLFKTTYQRPQPGRVR